jgi:hypothetical protein
MPDAPSIDLTSVIREATRQGIATRYQPAGLTPRVFFYRDAPPDERMPGSSPGRNIASRGLDPRVLFL